MLSGKLIIIFPYDGALEFDVRHPTYKGGMQRARRVKSDITFAKLKEITLAGSSWDTSVDNIRIEYIHHNGQTYSLICIKNDDDISCVFDLSGNNLN